MTSSREAFDVVLVGAGLANGLIALRLAELRPELRLLVLESGGSAGGNHTWSFHAGDLTAAQLAWIDPLVAHRWADYDVLFPGRQRRVRLAYRSIPSGGMASILRERLSGSLRCGAEVAEVRPQSVRMASGQIATAAAVIDGRGFLPSSNLRLAYQTFLGREVELETPHGLEAPVLMDARVEQSGGYRFVYVLPLAPNRLLVEDTYYANTAQLDADTLRTRIDAYIAGRGWRVHAVLREEQGVLPVVLGGDIEAFLAERGDVPCSGLRAGLFHHTTGYSLPDAVRLADRIAELPHISSAALTEAIGSYVRQRWSAQSFFRLLNRMLFLAGEEQDRYKVMRRFYDLPEPLVARFYAGRLSLGDRVRLLAGKPPVPVIGALKAAFSKEKGAP